MRVSIRTKVMKLLFSFAFAILLNAQGEKDVREILAAVRKDVAAHAGAAEQSDDITMLGLRFLG